MVKFQDGRENGARAVLSGSIVIQMEAVAPEPVIADRGKGNSSFLYGGYGHADIRRGLKLLGDRQDPLRIRKL